MSQLPIADYALISDCHSSGLISRRGSVDWLCFPRFDSPSVFARLLDETGGHWLLRPTSEATVTRRYLEGTLVLRTTFRTPTGTAVLLDTLAIGPNLDGHHLGAGAPHGLLRRVRCTQGKVEFETEYAPRPEYGLVLPQLRQVDGGVLARGGAVVLLLSSTVSLKITGSTARGRFRLHGGQALEFSLHYRSSAEPSPTPWVPHRITHQLEQTVRAWRSWSKLHQGYQGPWKALVQHSGRVLQALTYYPTGAIIAAPTTSLPEVVGGTRNWDYRYSWVRDASLTMDALWIAACPDESAKFFDFMAASALTQVQRGVDMQIMFGVGGEHDLSERELSHLSGWRGSYPVRIGNGAWSQRQLDIYGELLNAAYRLRDHFPWLDETRQFLIQVADTAAQRWREPDQGIWEIRGQPQHFLYSKLMCWVALDRSIALADFLQSSPRIAYWQEVRAGIRQAILTQGWNERRGAFTQAFGSNILDAASLLMPIVGFLPADDPRMLRTIDAIETYLTDRHGLVYRYRTEDGLEGKEGAFLLCTFWLAQALALAGQIERAKKIFFRAIAFTNDVGLLAEEVDPHNGELLGNFPQAFSHIGLINAAWAIAQAEQNLT